MLCMPVSYLHPAAQLFQLAPTLWVIDLSATTCHIKYTFLSLCQFFSWENRQNMKNTWSSTFLYDMKIAADGYYRCANIILIELQESPLAVKLCCLQKLTSLQNWTVAFHCSLACDSSCLLLDSTLILVWRWRVCLESCVASGSLLFEPHVAHCCNDALFIKVQRGQLQLVSGKITNILNGFGLNAPLASVIKIINLQSIHLLSEKVLCVFFFKVHINPTQVLFIWVQ